MKEFKLPTTIANVPNDEYHAMPGISKSGLWDLWDKTPAHYRYGERSEKTERHLLLGQAIHCGILEPDQYEARYRVGPAARKNAKAWTDVVEANAADGFETLDPTEDKTVRSIRDNAHRNSTARALLNGAVFEQTGLWEDDETGVLCRCRPDAYNRKLNIIGDLKSAENAGYRAFAAAIGRYGYHVQHAFYSEGWTRAAKLKRTPGFIFMVYEKAAPFAFAAYELDAAAVAEGQAVMRRALSLYAEHHKAEQVDPKYRWPAYPTSVQPIALPRWSFTETNQD
jgi:exodeoxyribonuclease VIII